MKKIIQIVQWGLSQLGKKPGPIDGLWGPKTATALAAVTEIPTDWSRKKKLTAFIQWYATHQQIEAGPVDGLWGPQTQFAFDQLMYLREHGEKESLWRDETPLDVNPNNWPVQTPERELIKFYGEVGKNQTRVQLPYTHKIAWNTRQTINSFYCHEKVHDSLSRVLNRVLEHYGEEKIKELRLDMFGGCLNVRKMRGGSRYSMHSWGIAVDYDPANNRLKWGRDKATFARKEYDAWWRIWEEEGWASLGRIKNYDWMHVQAAKL